MKKQKGFINSTILFTPALITLLLYTVVGTNGDVEEIKKLAPYDIETNRGWKILRYEGWQYGSFMNHGGKVWYHVANTDNPSIQYRVYVTIWNDELQYTYGQPEKLSRFDLQGETSISVK